MDVPAFYINLPSRPDRVPNAKRVARTLGLASLTRVPAVSGPDLEARYEARHGKQMPQEPRGTGHLKKKQHLPSLIACKLSHKKALRQADAPALVLEDDVALRPDHRLPEMWERFLSLDLEWDLLLVGGNPLRAEPVEEGLLRVYRASYAHAYVVSASGREKLLEVWSNGDDLLALDALWWKVMHEGRCYMLDPPQIVQLNDYSDIWKRKKRHRLERAWEDLARPSTPYIGDDQERAVFDP